MADRTLKTAILFTADGTPVVQAVDKMEGGLDDLGAAAKRASAATTDAMRSVERDSQKAAAAASRVGDALAGDGQIERSLEEQAQAIGQLDAALEAAGVRIDQVAAAEVRYQRAIEATEQQRKAGTLSAEAYAERMKRINDQLSPAAVLQRRQTEETQKASAAFSELRATLDPAFEAEKRLADISQRVAAGQQAINAALARGEINQGQASVLSARLNTEMGKLEKGTKLAGYQITNFGYQVQDVFTQLASGQSPFIILAQQGPQAISAVGGTRNALALLASAATSPLAPLALLAAAFAAGYAAMEHYDGQLREIATAQRATARPVGETTGALAELSAEAGRAAGLSTGAARSMAAELVRAGVSSAAALQDIIGLSRDLGVAMGQDAGDAAAELAADLADPTKAAEKYGRQLGAVDLATLNVVREMQLHGREADAAGVVIDALKAKTQGLAEDGLSPLGSWWDKVATKAGNAWSAMGQALSGGSLENQIADLEATLARAKANAPGLDPSYFAASEAKLAQLKADLARTQADAKQAAIDADNQRKAFNGDTLLRQLNLDPVKTQRELITGQISTLSAANGKPGFDDRAGQAAIDALNRALETQISETDRLSRQQEIEAEAAHKVGLERQVYLAVERERIALAGKSLTNDEVQRRLELARAGVINQMTSATTDMVVALHQQASAEDLLAAAAGRGAAAQRAAQAEAQARQIELTQGSAAADAFRSAQPEIEAATERRIRAEAIAQLEEQTRATLEAAGAAGKGGAAERAAAIETKARSLALQEAIAGTADYDKALEAYRAALTKVDEAESTRLRAANDNAFAEGLRTQTAYTQALLAGAGAEREAALAADARAKALAEARDGTQAYTEAYQHYLDQGRASQPNEDIQALIQLTDQAGFGVRRLDAQLKLWEGRRPLAAMLEEAGELPGAVAAVEREIRNLNNKIELASITGDDFGAGWQRSMVEYRQATEDAAAQGSEAFRAFASASEDALANLFMTGKLGFKDFFHVLEAEAARLAAKNILGSIFTSSASKATGSFIGGIASSVGSWIGGLFADGGRPPVGKVSVVGERGAELFVPDTAGTVIANDNIATWLAAQGRNGDSMVAHINPAEARLLKRLGGAGTINPVTGLMEFYDGSENDRGIGSGGGPSGSSGGNSGGGGNGSERGGVSPAQAAAAAAGREDEYNAATGKTGGGGGYNSSPAAGALAAAGYPGAFDPREEEKSTIQEILDWFLPIDIHNKYDPKTGTRTTDVQIDQGEVVAGLIGLAAGPLLGSIAKKVLDDKLGYTDLGALTGAADLGAWATSAGATAAGTPQQRDNEDKFTQSIKELAAATGVAEETIKQTVAVLAKYSTQIAALNPHLSESGQIAAQAASDMAQLTSSLNDVIKSATDTDGKAMGDAAKAQAAAMLELAASTSMVIPPLSDVEKEVETARAHFVELAKVVAEFGGDADLVSQGLEATLADYRRQFEDELRTSMLTPTEKAFQELTQKEQQRLADAKTLGADLVLTEQANAAERLAFLNGLSDAERAALLGLTDVADQLALSVSAATSSADNILNAQLSAARAAQQAAKQAADAWRQAQGRIGDTLADARIGDLSPFSRTQQFNEAQSAFNDAVTKALAGDQDAASGLPALYQNLLKTAQDALASSADYAAVFDQASQKLEAVQVAAGQLADQQDAAASLDEVSVGLLQEIRDAVAAGADPARLTAQLAALSQVNSAIGALAAGQISPADVQTLIGSLTAGDATLAAQLAGNSAATVAAIVSGNAGIVAAINNLLVYQANQVKAGGLQDQLAQLLQKDLALQSQKLDQAEVTAALKAQISGETATLKDLQARDARLGNVETYLDRTIGKSGYGWTSYNAASDPNAIYGYYGAKSEPDADVTRAAIRAIDWAKALGLNAAAASKIIIQGRDVGETAQLKIGNQSASFADTDVAGLTKWVVETLNGLVGGIDADKLSAIDWSTSTKSVTDALATLNQQLAASTASDAQLNATLSANAAQEKALRDQIAALTGIPAHAGGTPWAPGGASWLAEEGPEIVTRPGIYPVAPGSRVLTASQTRALLASAPPAVASRSAVAGGSDRAGVDELQAIRRELAEQREINRRLLAAAEGQLAVGNAMVGAQRATTRALAQPTLTAPVAGKRYGGRR